jgi:hypothetical protein
MTEETNATIERRIFRVQLRMVGVGDRRRLVGYGAVFNQISEDLGGFREIVLPGAFANALEGDVRSLFNHDPNLILGRTVSDTLHLAEDDVGLRYEVDLPDTQYARDLEISVDRGDVDQSSFGFRAIEESWRNPDENNPLPTRILHELKLFDTGPVTFPAYPMTSVQVRDMAKQLLAGGATGGDAGDERAVGRLAILRRRLDLAETL